MKKELVYKTFDELISEVAVDFKMYNAEGYIDPAQLIKVAQKCNYDLGLRINMTKETIIEIDNGKAKLPDDFDVLNYALLLDKYVEQEVIITGTQREDVAIVPDQYCSRCGHTSVICKCHTVITNDCGTHFQVIEKYKTQTRVYEKFERLHFKRNSRVSKVCSDSSINSSKSAELKNNHVYIPVDTGKIYISYQGAMEDEDGNLLVLDNPVVNEYYEYAIKERLLENLYFNGEDVERKLNLAQQKLRIARNNAKSLVNMPDFDELKKVHDMNRKVQYHKYYNMFSSYAR